MTADARLRRADWVALRVMPYEGAVRKWLGKSRVSDSESDDLIQQAYCRLAELDSVDGIVRPDAYFFETVRRLFLENARRARVVSLDSIAEIGAIEVHSDEPSPERIVAARRELETVLRLIERLPGRCKRVFQLRKIHGVSQKEIANRLGITETTVENDVAKGLRLISRAVRNATPSSLGSKPGHHERRRNRQSD